MKKNINILPNIVTAFGLACGLLLIFKTNLVEAGENSEKFLRISILLLVIAAVADLVDGLIARFIKAESDFGMLFDSLSDGITFGVAPSVLMLKSLSIPAGSVLSFFTAMGAMVYSICGVLRLVRYNVRAQKTRNRKKKAHFTGLPIPAGAGAAVAINFLLLSSFFKGIYPMKDEQRAVVLILAMILIGYLMISHWKFPSVKTLSFRTSRTPLVLFSMLFAIVIVYGVIYNFELLFFALCWGYMLVGFFLSLVKRMIGKKSKLLSGFYPNDEEGK